jgi:hypothetical protein
MASGEPGYPGGEPLGLPDIEALTVAPPSAGRSPEEPSAIMRHSMGLADAPPRQRDPGAPDVSELREELGL